ncbi:hypothetical protein HDU87_007165 [Geranomyces variabilis]|uniref:Uncharacterized protein n=1 Tax=Geranomyces variabilis TaxID=109894 RepID=A0AAD5TF29_9FUNG|nr:hypothetical protein HDU87_007165 [Geranomyces variabilis]
MPPKYYPPIVDGNGRKLICRECLKLVDDDASTFQHHCRKLCEPWRNARKQNPPPQIATHPKFDRKTFAYYCNLCTPLYAGHGRFAGCFKEIYDQARHEWKKHKVYQGDPIPEPVEAPVKPSVRMRRAGPAAVAGSASTKDEPVDSDTKSPTTTTKSKPKPKSKLKSIKTKSSSTAGSSSKQSKLPSEKKRHNAQRLTSPLSPSDESLWIPSTKKADEYDPLSPPFDPDMDTQAWMPGDSARPSSEDDDDSEDDSDDNSESDSSYSNPYNLPDKLSDPSEEESEEKDGDEDDDDDDTVNRLPGGIWTPNFWKPAKIKLLPPRLTFPYHRHGSAYDNGHNGISTGVLGGGNFQLNASPAPAAGVTTAASSSNSPIPTSADVVPRTPRWSAWSSPLASAPSPSAASVASLPPQMPSMMMPPASPGKRKSPSPETNNSNSAILQPSKRRAQPSM